MKVIPVLAAILGVLFAQNAVAADFPAQGRVFVGVIDAKIEDVNTEMTAEGLKEFKSMPQYGVEITYSLAKYFGVGMRYSKRNMSRDEEPSDLGTDYTAVLDQDAILFLGRASLLKTSFFRIDAYAGVGGTNTKLTIKTAAQDGEISRKDPAEWLASPYLSYGASVAIGFKRVYLVIEGGMETNEVSKLKRTGTANTNIETIDLSGSYVSIGLLFDGVKTSKK